MIEKLQEIGLTAGEIKVYEALLELGDSTKTPIAKRSGISPGKVYDVLERLIRKGLVSTAKKERIMHFHVANPKQILEYVNKKKNKIIEEESIARDILPYLIEKYNSKIEESDTELYRGWNGLESVYEDIVNTLRKGEIDYVLGGNSGTNPKKTELFFSRFNEKRIQKGVKMKMIYNDSDKSHLLSYLPKDKKVEELKFINLQTPAEINLYKNRVVIVILTLIPIAIVIKSKEAYESFLLYFNELWKVAKK